LVVVVLGYVVYRLLTRGDHTHSDRGIGAFAGEV
jgi:hypothetical protein